MHQEIQANIATIENNILNMKLVANQLRIVELSGRCDTFWWWLSEVRILNGTLHELCDVLHRLPLFMWILLGGVYLGFTGNLFGPFLSLWVFEGVQIEPKVAQEPSQKRCSKMNQTNTTNWNLNRMWKLNISSQNGLGALQAELATLPLEVPCLPLVFSSPLRWLKSYILTPTCAKFGH